MGFWDSFWKDMDKPAFVWERRIHIDDPKESQEAIRLKEENQELRRLLQSKKVNAIDADYKLLK